MHTSPWIVPDQRSLQVMEQIRPWAVEQGFEAGSSLFEQGEKVPGLFFVTAGTVKQVHLSPQGNERLFTIVSAGCPVGEVSALDGMPSQVTAVAMTDVSTLFVERRRVLELLREEGELAVFLALTMGRQLRASMLQLADTSNRAVYDRLCCLLHHLARQKGPDQKGSQTITLRINHQQLSEMLGVARATVSSVIADLKAQGVLETGHGLLQIRKLAALRTCGNSPRCIARAGVS